IRRRHGGVAAVLHYGSCLRRRTLEGVLDYFVLVDSYRTAYRSRRLAVLNRLVPPNVFRIDVPTSRGVLKAKYAVLTVADFARAVGRRHPHPYVWGRFAQPAALVYCRDEPTQRAVAGAVTEAVITAVQWSLPFAAGRGGTLDLTPEGTRAFWLETFRRTYGTELRTEREATIAKVYDADPVRYDIVLGLALHALEGRGVRRAARSGWRRLAGRAAWAVRVPAAKALAGLRLAKSIATFDDWLPYALWKLERHTGVRPVLSDRQRRHPLLFGWPVLVKVMARGAFR
ncbi:MAG: hypothetical protein AB7S39_23625, partial [Gemmatimonadales bacterium]